MNLWLSHQELQQNAEVAWGEGQQEGAQTAVDDLHTGPALRAALAGLLKGPDGLDGTVNQHQRRQEEPKHLHTDDHLGAPAFPWKPVEAVELFPPGLSEAIGGRKNRCQHHHPDRQAGPQSCSGWPQLLGFERVTDSHPSVHSYTHDGVDAAIYANKIQTFQDRTETLEVGVPTMISGVHFEGKREEEEQVHQSQAGHVDRWLRPFLQNDAEHKQRHSVENQTSYKYGDVDDQLQILHHGVHVCKWTVDHRVDRRVDAAAAGKNFDFDLISAAQLQFQNDSAFPVITLCSHTETSVRGATVPSHLKLLSYVGSAALS